MPCGNTKIMAYYSIGSVVSGMGMHGIVVNVEPTYNSYMYTCAAEQLSGNTWTSLESGLVLYPLSLGSTLAMIDGFHSTWITQYPHVVKVIVAKVGSKKRRRRGHAEATALYHYPKNMDADDRQRHMDQGKYPKFMDFGERRRHEEIGMYPKFMSDAERRQSMQDRM